MATTETPLTPLDADLRAGELHDLMGTLSALDLHPITSAADIEATRIKAEQAAREILGYLITSANFAPVVEADDAVQEWEL
jgi:hypothetical protein